MFLCLQACICALSEAECLLNNSHTPLALTEERAKVTTPQRETTCDLPQSVKAYIDRDNTSFEDWIQEIALTRVRTCTHNWLGHQNQEKKFLSRKQEELSAEI